MYLLYLTYFQVTRHISLTLDDLYNAIVTHLGSNIKVAARPTAKSRSPYFPSHQATNHIHIWQAFLDYSPPWYELVRRFLRLPSPVCNPFILPSQLVLSNVTPSDRIAADQVTQAVGTGGSDDQNINPSGEVILSAKMARLKFSSHHSTSSLHSQHIPSAPSLTPTTTSGHSQASFDGDINNIEMSQSEAAEADANSQDCSCEIPDDERHAPSSPISTPGFSSRSLRSSPASSSDCRF